MRESRRKADAGTRDCGCLTERGETRTRKKKNKTGLCVYLIRPGVLMMNANTWELSLCQTNETLVRWLKTILARVNCFRTAISRSFSHDTNDELIDL